MTNTSLTAMQAMVSTPFGLSCEAFSMKPGRCFASQVGVKAPGTENRTTVLPLKSWSEVRVSGPSLPITLREPAGSLSPTLIVIANLLWENHLPGIVTQERYDQATPATNGPSQSAPAGKRPCGPSI